VPDANPALPNHSQSISTVNTRTSHRVNTFERHLQHFAE
jgi:hypothetical protein